MSLSDIPYSDISREYENQRILGYVRIRDMDVVERTPFDQRRQLDLVRLRDGRIAIVAMETHYGSRSRPERHGWYLDLRTEENGDLYDNPECSRCSGNTQQHDQRSNDIATLQRRLEELYRQIAAARTSLDMAAINPWEWAADAQRSTAGTRHAAWATREAQKLVEQYRRRSEEPGRRRNPPARLSDTDARDAEKALHGHYEAKHRDGVAAWKQDIALRYAGALAHWSSLGMPALRAEANRRGIRTSSKVTKAALVTRLARILVPEWREGAEEKVPRTCRPPKLTKQDKAMLANAPEEEQELAESLTRFCDTTDPDDARERCADLDAAAQAAGYVSVADAMTGWGMSRIAVEKFYDLCPAQIDAEPIPF